jgi:hypothetical protein
MHDGLDSLQMAGDAACFARALHGLDEYTIVAMRGSEEHAEDDLLLVERALRKRPSAAPERLRPSGASGSVGGGSSFMGEYSQRLDKPSGALQVVNNMLVRLYLAWASLPCQSGRIAAHGTVLFCIFP